MLCPPIFNFSFFLFNKVTFRFSCTCYTSCTLKLGSNHSTCEALQVLLLYMKHTADFKTLCTSVIWRQWFYLLYYLLLYSKISVDQPLKFFREYLFSSFQATLLKRDSSASVFQWIVRNFLRKPIFWNTYEWLPLYIVRLIQPGEKFACTRFITHLIQLYRKYKNKKLLLICSQIQNKVRYGF